VISVYKKDNEITSVCLDKAWVRHDGTSQQVFTKKTMRSFPVNSVLVISRD
jgi:hypothetical protein